jgi:hypothetical protein
MRLLHCLTLEFEEIDIDKKDDIDKKGYAILSHRWGKPGDEVSYQEMCDKSGKQKPGYER